MEIKDFMLFTDNKIFGDDKEHEYIVICNDGIAHGTPTDDVFMNNKNAPARITLAYPKLDELSEAKKREILDYCGLYNAEPNECNHRDVCLAIGKIVGYEKSHKQIFYENSIPSVGDTIQWWDKEIGATHEYVVSGMTDNVLQCTEYENGNVVSENEIPLSEYQEQLYSGIVGY